MLITAPAVFLKPNEPEGRALLRAHSTAAAERDVVEEADRAAEADLEQSPEDRVFPEGQEGDSQFQEAFPAGREFPVDIVLADTGPVDAAFRGASASPAGRACREGAADPEDTLLAGKAAPEPFLVASLAEACPADKLREDRVGRGLAPPRDKEHQEASAFPVEGAGACRREGLELREEPARLPAGAGPGVCFPAARALVRSYRV